jgi:hypothetical protein
MTATLSAVPAYAPTTVLLDTRPARGKHRTRRNLSDLAGTMLAWSRRQRGAWLLTATTVGGLLAPVLLP